MGRGETSRGIWAAIAALVLFAFGAGAWLINDGIKSERAHQQQTHNRAYDYSTRANVAIERTCRPLPADKELQCIREENKAAREGAYNENDLKAQLVTSVWTRQMGIAAIIAMAFGVLGVGLVFVTFRESRRAANAAEQTYRAFVAAEDATISVEFGGTPILTTLNGERHEQFLLHPAIANDGRSTAHIQHCSFDGEDIPVDYTLEPGKKFGLPEPIGLGSADAFEFAVHYSTPLRPIAVLTVTVEPRKSPNNAGKARGTIIGRRIEFPEAEGSKQG